MSTLKNKAGRTYERGKPLSNNVRHKIISELEQKFNGNKQNYSISRGGFSEVSKKFCVSKPTVSSIWTKYCTDTLGSDTWKPRGRPKKLTDADLDFIEHMKTQKPLATADTINAELSTHSTTRVTPRTINTAVRSYLPRRWTNKKVDSQSHVSRTQKNQKLLFTKKDKKKKPRTAIDIETPELLKIITDNDVDCTEEEISKKDPVKIGEVDEHVTCDSNALYSVKDDTVVDNMAFEKLDTADINTCIVEKQDLISKNGAQSTDKVVISDELETLKVVKIEKFDHTVEAADLEASFIKHSEHELKSQENDKLQNLGPYPIAQSQNLVPYPILQSILQSQNFNPNAQSRIIDPLYVTRERGEVPVGEKCDEFSCVNQGKYVDNGTVYRNKQPYDCRLGSSGPRCEKEKDKKKKKKKKKPRTGTDIEHPELLKILSDNDVGYTAEEISKMDPVKIGEVDEHITCDSDALRSVKDQTVADNMVSEKLDTADINTCIVEKHDLISNNDAQSTDKVVISDEVETLKPVKIETFDHTVEAPDLEASSIKHSNSELKSQENDMLQNLGPYPSPQSQNLMPYPIAQSQNLVPYPILQSNLQSQNFNPNAQSRIIDPLYVTREREVLVREKCDEFSCVNQGKFVDNGTVYRNKQPYDCRLGSSGPRWEKEKDKKKKKKPRTAADIEHPELLKILSDNDVGYTAEEISKKDPVKIGEVDEHIRCESDALHSVKDKTVADNRVPDSMATEKLDTADINTCFVEKQDLISNTDAQSIDKVVIPDKVENLKPVKMETFYHTVEAADPEASSIKHSDSELKSQENDQLQNLGPYPSPQSQNLMPYPSPQSQNLVPFHPVAQSQNFVSYPIAQSQNFVSYPIAQLQNLVSYSIAQSQIINPLYVTRERGDVPVSEKGDEFPCKNQGMYVDNGTVYKKKLPCDSRLVTSGLRCEKDDSEPMNLTKETIKTENVDDTSSDASTESKSRKREKSMLNQPPLKRSRSSDVASDSTIIILDDDGSETDVSSDTPKREKRKKANNARERNRVRDLNATFEELGKLVKFYIQIEHCMTKLQILKQAVNLITALAQQVREYKLKEKKTEDLVQGHLQSKEMKDASSQVGDSAFGPKITDANPTMGEIFNDSNHVRSEVNSASQEPSSIEIDSFTLNDQKDPAIQCDSFHQNNSFTQRVNFDPAENRTYHKGSPFSEDCANHSDNFDKSLHFFPHKVSQFGKDSFTYNDNFDQTVNTIPQKASPFANNYVLHSDNFDKSVHFAPHNVLQFGKDSITHKDSCDQTLNSIPQKASTFAQDSVFHNDNIDQSLNRTPYLRFLEKPANCSANFDHAMSAHQKASPFGKDIVAQCDNFDQQVNSAPMRTEPFEKDTDIHCDNFDQQVNSAPQRTQPFEKDTDIHCDHIDQAAESDKPLDNNISMPREKSIQVICQPVEINGKIVDRDIIGKSRFTGLVEDIRSVQNSQAIQDSATSEIVVKQEISEPERLKEYRFIQNSGIIKEILTNKEDKSSPEWPLESTRPIEDRGTDARSVTNELFVKQEESHTDRLVEEIKSTQNTVEEYVRSKIVVKHEESNTIEISPVEPEITANSIIDKEKQSHKERPVNEIGSIQNTGTVEGCIVSDVVKEENGETDSIAENVRSKQNAALIRESVASEVVIKQEKSDDKEIFQVESEMEESRSSETNINEKLDTEGFPQVQNTVVHEESETSESVRRQEMSDTEGVSRLEPGMLAKSIAESIENWVRSMKHTGAGEDSVLSDSFATEGKSGTESAIGGVVVKEGKKCTERLLQVDIDRIANLVQGIESDSGNLQEISASEPCNSVLNNNDGRHVYQSNSLMQGSPSVPYVQIEYDVPVHMEGTDMQPYSKIRLETIDDRTISSIEGNKPEQMSRNLEQEVCRICGDSASGLLSCVHCSMFFKRSIRGGATYLCKYGGNCAMGLLKRRKCRACWLRRCWEVGMKKELSDTQAAKGTQAKVFCKNGENDRNMIVELSDEESIIELSDQDSNCSDKERMTIHGDKVHDRIRDRSDED